MISQDQISGASAMDFQVSVSSLFGGSGIIQLSICFAIVVTLFRLEVARRSAKAKLSPRTPESNGKNLIAHVKNFLEHFAPELIGLAVCITMACALRMNGTIQQIIDDKGHPEVLDKVLRKWPLLLTADSLLSLQSMLRLLVLVSSVIRTGTGSLPLSQEAAATSCMAMLGRVALVLRNKVFMLDGPLGGYLPMACDLVSAPLLAILSCGINRKGFLATALAVIVAAGIGSTNRINLAEDRFDDGLFIAIHTTEIFAAFAYLSRSLFTDVAVGSAGQRNVALWFAHIVMPIQASLSAYYFIEAFHAVPQMVGAGYPFAILHLGGMATVAVYAGAAVLHITPCEAKELAPLQLTQDLNKDSAVYGELQLSEQGLP